MQLAKKETEKLQIMRNHSINGNIYKSMNLKTEFYKYST